MRQTRMAMGLALALGAASAATAQTARPETGRRGAPNGQEAKPGERSARGQRGGPDGFLLRGITLTDAQKARLQALREQERAQFEARREGGRGGSEAVREARERGDTAELNRLRQARRAEMEQRRERHVAAVRSILTAEQRQQLDANVAELKQREAQRAERGPKARRGGRRG